MQDFLTFVDANSQLNGHSANSSGSTHYFLSKFSTLQAPAPSYPPVQEQLSRSVVGEFNRAQLECGRGECSNSSCHNCLKKHRPKHSVCPHKEDYCDACAEENAEVRAKQTILNRLPEDLKKLDDWIKVI